MNNFTRRVVIGIVLGIGVGLATHEWVADPTVVDTLSELFGLTTEVFLRLIKMIIAPLVLTTLAVGIAKMGDASKLGRIGGRALVWFFATSFIGLVIGLVIVNWLQPGAAMHLALPPMDAQSGIAKAPTLKEFISHVVPRSAAEAMANNEILQLVVFAAFVGMALAQLGDKARAITEQLDQWAHVMLKVTSYVMNVAPVAVFAALAATVMKEGVGILAKFGLFLGGFYCALLAVWVMLLALSAVFIGPRTLGLLKAIREPVLLAFSTASSEAAYPKTLAELERFGVSERIASFVLPLGYSFNLIGSTMYCTFATLFIAQAYGIHLSQEQQLTMLLLLMVTSKGMAGVPRASLVVIAATLTHFGIPEAGLLLIVAVDHVLDMGRSATNVVGNCIATVVLARFEGELRSPQAGPSEL